MRKLAKSAWPSVVGAKRTRVTVTLLALVFVGFPTFTHAAERFYYSVEDRDAKSVVRRGNSNTNGLRLNELILKQNTRYRYWLYDSERGHVGFSEFTTPGAGLTFSVPPPAMRLPTTPDQDGDGLPDEVEQLITGSSVTNPDTDGDGIQDGAAAKLGLLNRTLPPTGIIGSVDTAGNAVDVAAFNDLVVVADSDRGISVFNVFNRMNPVIVAQVDTPGTATAVAIAGNLIAVADGPAGLAIVDISDPPNARIIHQIALPSDPRAVVAAGTAAYVGLASGQLLLIDLPSGSILTTKKLPNPVEDLALAGDELYVLTSTSLSILGAFDRGLQQLGSIPVGGDPSPLEFGRKLFVGGGIAYVGYFRGYSTIAVTNPVAPVLMGSPSTTQAAIHDIVANGSGKIVAVTSFTGPDTLAVSLYVGTNPMIVNNLETSFDTPGEARAVAIYNGLAYVADGSSGLQVVNYLSLDVSNRAPGISLSGSLLMLNPTNATAEDGKWVRVTADVTDDVQVRNVEFYLDGVKAATDGNFPFEFRFVAPRRDSQPSFRLKARASDTGGNATWTEEILVTLTPDRTPPVPLTLAPADNTNLITVDFLAAYFNEPLDSNSVSAAALEIRSAGVDNILGTADDVILSAGSVSYNETLNAVLVSFGSPLAAGFYQITLRAPLADASGNSLSSPVTWRFVVLQTTTVVGRVLDTNGMPVAGANVVIGGIIEVSGFTDPGGNFSLDRVPVVDGRFTVAASVLVDGILWYGRSSHATSLPGEMSVIGNLVVTPLPKTVQPVAAGNSHALAIKADGTLWAWGGNWEGQLGTGGNWDLARGWPEQVGTNSDWISVAAGYEHTIGLRDNGTLWCWGGNGAGQLGLGLSWQTFGGTNIPTQVGSNSNWVAIAAGDYHSAGLQADGSLWIWGYNRYGQVGDGVNIDAVEPTKIDGDLFWIAVSLGGYHTLAIDVAGRMWGWGLNDCGQLGIGVFGNNQNRPVLVNINTDWISVACGEFANAAYSSDGSLWTWGCGDYGQLGNGTWGDGNVPVRVPGPRDWTGTLAVDLTTAAIKSDGSLWLWGGNFDGQLADGTWEDSNRPVRIGVDTNWTHVDVGEAVVVALRSDGSLFTWGGDAYFETGNLERRFRSLPAPTTSAYLWSEVASGAYHAIGIGLDGALWAWGGNNYGQLGDGTFTNRATPALVDNANGWGSVAAGWALSVAVRDDGTLWAWGLGIGPSLRSTNLPTQVGSDNVWKTVWTQNSDYPGSSLALRSNGTLWAWGNFAATNRPAQIGNDADWIRAAIGSTAAYAIKQDNTVWAWGDNYYGELGVGRSFDELRYTNSPVQIGTDRDWLSVAAGNTHAIGLKRSGSIWAWGSNRSGGLGLGLSYDRLGSTNSPVQVGADTDWVGVAASGRSTFALKQNGSLWAWGDGSSGQLGVAELLFRSTNAPVQVTTNQDWTRVFPSPSYTLALKTNRTLWGCGRNYSGELGNGEASYVPAPIDNTTNWWRLR